ncbi:MAG: DUF5916 domain-containing protein [Bacteroidales bacterium]
MGKISLLILAGVVFLLFCSTTTYGKEDTKNRLQQDTTQQKRQIIAIKTDDIIQVDGLLNENAWKKVPAAEHFTTYSPSIGDTSKYTTEVKVVYDDNAIFFGAFLKDNPDSMLTALSKRDDEDVNADKFWITLNPYNDGKNIFKFAVTPTNVQSDIKMSPGKYDRSWDAVWQSEVGIIDSGWVVEMRIPYDAIRFPNGSKQNWSVNFWREVKRERAISSWNFVNRTKDNEGSQYGELINIRDIQSPFRLSLFPYVSGYLSPTSDGADYSYSAGMDLKYGINESFTLDMILIPDFGQKKSDNTVLNLSPFEVRYSEKRQFFTEGTELFNKAGLFYSRRVGGLPAGYGEVGKKLNEEEDIIENPDEANLINATKISGRNQNGLGLGFFNAETGKTYATVKDTINGQKRKILTEPFTNYNILVADKNIGQNSYINLINTNYFQPSTGKIENVTGTAYKISPPSNNYAIWGTGGNSIQQDSTSGNLITGQRLDTRMGKVSGNFTFNYRFRLLTDTYDQNALGYLRKNNELTNQINIRYRGYEPTGSLLNWNARLSLHQNLLYKPRHFSEFNIVASYHATFQNYVSGGLWSKYRPIKMYDYYEPRLEDRKFQRPEFFYINTWVSSDSRKPLAFDLKGGMRKGDGDGYFYSAGPRIRIGNKFNLRYNFEYDLDQNKKGYVTNYTEENVNIIFGRRDETTYTNNISGSFIFNNKSWINLNFRHYWSQVDYNKFYKLNQNGTLNENINYQENEDFNFNVFNIDLMYSWNFAPGSFLNVVWKNSLAESETIQGNEFYDFFENFNNTLTSNGIYNSFSIKISYYLDYKYLLKKAG